MKYIFSHNTVPFIRYIKYEHDIAKGNKNVPATTVLKTA